MRVAMVSEHASPLAALGGVDAGGQNVHVAALAAALARRGAEVVVYTRRDDPRQPACQPLAPGVVVDHVDAGPPMPLPKDELLPHMQEFAAELGQRWRAWRPDVVHAHFWMSGWASLQAARTEGIPVVQTFHALGTVKRRHQGPADTSPPERIEIERHVARVVDGIVASCSDEVFELIRLGADRRRIAVVPCGVDLDRFHPDGPAWPGPPAATTGRARGARVSRGRHLLVSVNRLVERKGLSDLVAALPQVPGAELVVAGGPPAAELGHDPEAQRVLHLAADLRVSDRLHLLGQMPHEAIPDLLRAADVAVCCPWYEPFGIVPVEAMACGVPVVATAVGGMIDTVVDGVTGVHVPARDPASLARALNGLLADPDLRTQLGRAGAARARARYGWDRVARATLEAYTTKAGGRGRARLGARR